MKFRFTNTDFSQKDYGDVVNEETNESIGNCNQCDSKDWIYFPISIGKLIAAAPDLLEACKTLLQAIDIREVSDEEMDGIVYNTKQAIQKAEGL